MAEDAINMNNTARAREREASADRSGVARVIWCAPYLMKPGHEGQHPGFRSWLLELFTHGQIDVRTQRFGWRRLDAGSGALYPPGCRYDEAVDAAGKPCRSICVLMGLGDGDLPAPFNADQPSIVHDRDGSARRLARTISETYRGDRARQMVAQGCLLQLVGLLQLGHRAGDELFLSPVLTAEHDLVARADAYMREHLAGRCRIRDIAKHVGMSDSGLSHAYKRVAGNTPMQVLRAFRIEAARTLVLRDQLSLEQIAEQTGFADAFHLSRTFKQVTGQTPRAYRKARIYQ